MRKYTDLSSGECELSPLPKADVLLFELETGDTVIVRPSGTEPKVKFYYLITAPSREEAIARYEDYTSTVEKIAASV